MNGNDCKKSKKRSVLQLCVDFGDHTTLHGVNRAVTRKHPAKRFIWLALVLCVSAWAVYQLIDVVQEYFTYPVATLVTMKNENQMVFPAVTICNLNSRKSSNTSEHFKTAITYYLKEKPPFYQIIIHAWARLEEAQDKTDPGHKMSDMLINCLYNEKPCSSDNFTELHNSKYGLCHTFVAQDEKQKYIVKPGPGNSLDIEMAIEQHEYISTSPQAGIKVLLHKSDEMPFLSERGIFVQPGVSTSIAVKKTILRRLPPPYGECVSQEEDPENHLFFFDEKRYKYTEYGCWKSCYQLATFKDCSCCDANLPCDSDEILRISGIEYEENAKVRICNVTVEDINCMAMVEVKFMNREVKCSNRCPPACEQTQFDAVISTSLWPTDAYMEVFLKHAMNTTWNTREFGSFQEFRNVIAKNYLKLEIFYDTLDIVEVTTQPLYTWSNLLGTIGGQLGLWLGFSILTAIELLELCFDIALLYARRLHGNVKTKRDEEIGAHV